MQLSWLQDVVLYNIDGDCNIITFSLSRKVAAHQIVAWDTELMSWKVVEHVVVSDWMLVVDLWPHHYLMTVQSTNHTLFNSQKLLRRTFVSF